MDSLFTFQAELNSETKNLYQEIRKNSAQHDSYNRLHSIQHDIAFVRKVAEEWYDGEFKVVANQRCGSWYTDPEVSRMTVVVAMLRRFCRSLTVSHNPYMARHSRPHRQAHPPMPTSSLPTGIPTPGTLVFDGLTCR